MATHKSSPSKNNKNLVEISFQLIPQVLKYSKQSLEYLSASPAQILHNYWCYLQLLWYFLYFKNTFISQLKVMKTFKCFRWQSLVKEMLWGISPSGRTFPRKPPPRVHQQRCTFHPQKLLLRFSFDFNTINVRREQGNIHLGSCFWTKNWQRPLTRPRGIHSIILASILLCS